jgi:hypothetical protein
MTTESSVTTFSSVIEPTPVVSKDATAEQTTTAGIFQRLSAIWAIEAIFGSMKFAPRRKLIDVVDARTLTSIEQCRTISQLTKSVNYILIQLGIG